METRKKTKEGIWYTVFGAWFLWLITHRLNLTILVISEDQVQPAEYQNSFLIFLRASVLLISKIFAACDDFGGPHNPQNLRDSVSPW
jgi:hypothetical protein